MSKKVILTGLRANNDLHLGNYLGALLPMVDMAKNRADEYEVNLMVADLHSFITSIDHSQLQTQIMQNLKTFAAAGLPLDHQDIRLFRQSYVPAHSELTWILNCFTGIGGMNRMTQFKDKAGIQEFKQNLDQLFDTAEKQGGLAKSTMEGLDVYKGEYRKAYEGVRDAYKSSLVQIESFLTIIEKLYKLREKESAASVGLFGYPVLMAADILLYNASYVPVGDDQTQHLEYTRDIAGRMNKQFGKLFTVPLPVAKQHEFFGKDQGLRVRDLLDPTKKMSKSDETGKGVIFLNDKPDQARKKIMGATTDSHSDVQYSYKERPGVSNLLDLLKLLGGNPDEFIAQKQYGPLKTAVADKVAAFLQDFRTKLAAVDEAALMQKLEASEAAMNQIANQTLHKVQQAVGLRPRS